MNQLRIRRSMLGLMILLLIPAVASRGDGAPEGPQSERERQAKKYGIDLHELERRARHDDGALRGVLLMATVMDGGAAEEMTEVVTELLLARGDERSIEILSSIDERLAKMAADHIAFDRGLYDKKGPTWNAFARKMPRTARFVEKNQ